MFGLTSTTISRLIPEAHVRWPTLDEQQRFVAAVQKRHRYVVGRWGFIDDKYYRVQKPTFADIQMPCITDGCIVHSSPEVSALQPMEPLFGVNTMSLDRGMTQRRNQFTGPCCRVLADTAFPTCKGLENRIKKEGELDRIPPASRREAHIRSDAVTSMRQSAESGMGAVEKIYRRLLDNLPWNQKKQARRINSIYRLYNIRVSLSLSGIRSYFFDDAR